MSKSKRAEVVEDPKAVSAMKELGTPWEIKDFNHADINWPKTMKNVGRIDQVVMPCSLEDYVASKLKGDEFPMGILCKKKEGIVVIAGVHRISADVKAGFNISKAYFVKLDFDWQFRLLAFKTNRKEGNRQDKEGAVIYAVKLVEKDGLSIKEAAEQLYISPNTLAGRIKANATRRQLLESGFKGEVSDAASKVLGKLAHNDKVLVATATICRRYALPADETKSLVSRVSTARTEAKQLSLIEDENDRLRTITKDKKTVVVRTTFSKFMSHFSRLKEIVADKNLADLQIESESEIHRQLKKDWKIVKANCNRMFN